MKTNLWVYGLILRRIHVQTASIYKIHKKETKGDEIMTLLMYNDVFI
jgi:hypothetical protein